MLWRGGPRVALWTGSENGHWCVSGALAGEHSGRFFCFTLAGEYACRIRKVAGQIFKHQPFEQITFVMQAGECDSRNGSAGERGAIQGSADLPVSHFVGILGTAVRVTQVGPAAQKQHAIRVHARAPLCNFGFERSHSAWRDIALFGQEAN